MKYIQNLKFSTDNPVQLAAEVLYANATFEQYGSKRVFSDSTQISPWNVTVITPKQIVSVPFQRKEINKGHEEMTDIILRMIYPNYISPKELGRNKVYSDNELNNIFVLVAGGISPLIMIWIQDSIKLTSKQYNELNSYMENLKQSKGVQNKTITRIFFGNSLINIADIDTKLQKLKNQIDDNRTLEQEYPITEFDFRGCETEEQYMIRAQEHAITFNRMISNTPKTILDRVLNKFDNQEPKHNINRNPCILSQDEIDFDER